jgi:AcrR family transcriptional regulator
MTSLRQSGTLLDGPEALAEDAPELPRARGRPRSPEADEAILKAAWGLLSEGRYDRMTFEAVADRAGCSRPTIYRRFRNKVEMVRALVEPMTEAMEPAVRPDGSPRDTLASYLVEFAAYLTDGGGNAIMALWQARREDPEMSAMLDDIYAQGRRPYVQMLAQLSKRRAPEDAYVVLVDAMLGAVMFRCVHCLKPIALNELELLVDQAMAAAIRI